MEEKIFISYKRQDISQVKELISNIKKHAKAKCWIDKKGIESGSEFENVIKKAIDNCEIVLFMMSDSSLLSEWTYRELMYAKKQSKRVVPVTLDGQQSRAWFKVEFGNLDCININDSENLSKLYRDLREWLGQRQTKVWKGTDLRVVFDDNAEIHEKNANDTFKKVIEKVKCKDVYDLKLECGKGHLLEKRQYDDLEPIGRGYYIPKKFQGKTILAYLKDISEGLNIGLKIYSPYAEEEEPAPQEKSVIDVVLEISESYESLSDEDLERIIQDANYYFSKENPTDKDYKKAFDLFKIAAAQGDNDSWNKLGIIFHNGQGVEANDSFAFQCFEQADKFECIWGKYNLLYCYLKGWGVSIDIQKSVTIASELKDSDEIDSESLGAAYFDIAKYVEAVSSLKQAKQYFDESILLGCEDAVNYLDALDDLKSKKHNHIFEMVVEDVFHVTGRGTVADGRILRGYIAVGDEVTVFNETDEISTVVIGIEMFRSLIDTAMAGDNVGLLLRDVEKKQVHRGDTIILTNQVTETGIDKLRNEIYSPDDEETEEENKLVTDISSEEMIEKGGQELQLTSNPTSPQTDSESQVVSSRKKKTGLIVILGDGTILSEPRASETMALAISSTNPERIAALEIFVDGANIVSREQHPLYASAQRPVGNGYFVNTHSNTSMKKKLLDQISDRLGLGWTITID